MTLDFAPRTIGRLKVLGIVTAAVIGTATVGAGIVSAWTQLGLPRIATVQYVEEAKQELKRLVEDIAPLVRQLQIDQLESRRQAMDREVFDLNQRIKAIAPSIDHDIEWRLHERERELQAIEAQINELRRRR